jgi:amino acid permease
MAARGNLVLLGLLTLVALPLSLHKSLGSLAFVTPVSLGSMVLLTVAVALRGGAHAAAHWDALEYRWGPREGDAVAAVLRSLPIFTLSYMCHFNALSMHAELVNPTRLRLKAVIGATLAVSTGMYSVFGVCGYLWAGDGTQGDVLAAFPANDAFVNAGRVRE